MPGFFAGHDIFGRESGRAGNRLDAARTDALLPQSAHDPEKACPWTSSDGGNRFLEKIMRQKNLCGKIVNL
jgi:hypothetical protein